MEKSKKPFNSELYDFLTATNVQCFDSGEFPDTLKCRLYNKHGVCINERFNEKKGPITAIYEYNCERDWMLKMWYKNQEPRNLSGKTVLVSIDGKDYEAIIK